MCGSGRVVLDDIAPDQVQDPVARQWLGRLLAMVEAQSAELSRLHELAQAQRDEIARLQGEQGTPRVRAQARQDRSSERERPVEPPAVPVVRRDVVLRLDRTTLPPGAEHAGYEDYVVQEVVFQADAVCYRCEAFRDVGAGSPLCRRA